MAAPSAVEHWTILAPEFPPKSGGVADHVQGLADELQRRGQGVEVWAPQTGVGRAERAYHRACDFSGRALQELERAVREQPATRVLVHYVPLTFGRVNPAFMNWMGRCPRPLWVMFHEVAYPLRWQQRLRQRALSVMTHWTARKLALRADRVLVSTPSFEPVLRLLAPRLGPIHWLPISSNIPDPAPGRTPALVRAELGLDPAASLVVHFGTVRGGNPLLEDTVKRLLADERVNIAVLGRGAEEVPRRIAVPSSVRRRIHAVGQSAATRVAEIIAASDLALYPFVDGVTTRRTSLMAALRLGTPVVTTVGATTEPVWYQDEPVRLVEPDAVKLSRVVLRLLGDAAARRSLAERGRRAYEQHFSIERAADALEAVVSIETRPRA